MLAGMRYVVLLTSIGVLARSSENIASSAVEEAELKALVEELGRRAREQETLIAKYEDTVAAPRKLLPGAPQKVPGQFMHTIFEGNDQIQGMTAWTAEERLKGGFDVMWVLICSALVMLMQAGFTMMEIGLTRWKSVASVLSKNLNTVFFATFGWWIFGWSFAHSGPYEHFFPVRKENLFNGQEQFAAHHFLMARADGQQEPSGAIEQWMFTWAKAVFAALIASGGMTERHNFPGPAIFAFLFSSFIFPFPTAWSHGWLIDPEEMNHAGFVDLAGSGTVCFVGGVGALMAAVIAKPRPNYYTELSAGDRMKYFPGHMDPHAVPLVVMGTLLLWFGWYGFNCGSIAGLFSKRDSLYAAQIAMNTTIAAASGGLVEVFLRSAINRKIDVGGCCAGIIAGLVSISAACGSVEVGSACAIAVVGALFYQIFSIILRMAKIDDVADSFSIYGAAGMWGVIAAPLFDWGMGFNHAHGNNGLSCIPDPRGGNCMGGAAKFQVAANFAMLGAIFLWVAVLSAIVLVVLKVTKLLAASKDIVGSAYVWPTGDDGQAFDNNAAKLNSMEL